MANERARALRGRMTPQEVKLWVQLRELRQQGYHFRRQAPRAGVIVDFVCLRQSLVIEIDGGQHGAEEHAARDAHRDRRLADRGLRTLRFWNADVDRNLDSVVDTIWHALQDAPDS
jgi:very-short-patch-repair endonuclease